MGRHDGMHYLLGCNGSGVAMMTYLGWQTARKIAGVANRQNAFDAEEFPTHPLYSGNPWFLPAVGGWYRLRDSVDRRLASLWSVLLTAASGARPGVSVCVRGSRD
jgi:hypothetical protein